MRKTIKNVLSEYGPVAVVVYFGIFFTVLFGAWTAIVFGWQPTSLTGNVGAFTAAYLTTKVTQPVRIAATLALTPVTARAYERIVRRGSPGEPM